MIKDRALRAANQRRERSRSGWSTALGGLLLIAAIGSAGAALWRWLDAP